MKKPPKPTGEVLNLGLARIRKGRTPRPKHGACRHLNQTYDEAERRVWCDDCGDEIEVFDAYMALINQYDRIHKHITSRTEEAISAEKHNLVSRAAKSVDKHWRKRDTVPLCPHCNEGLFPEDMVDGLSTASKKWLKQKRDKQKRDKQTNLL